MRGITLLLVVVVVVATMMMMMMMAQCSYSCNNAAQVSLVTDEQAQVSQTRSEPMTEHMYVYTPFYFINVT